MKQPTISRWLRSVRRSSRVSITGLYCSELGHECSNETMLRVNRERLFPDLDEKARTLYEKLLHHPGRRRRYVVPYEEIIARFDPQTKFERFHHTALSLMTDAAGGLLRQTGLVGRDFDFLIVNYMAGKTLPSLASRLANKLELRSDVVTYNLGDMGCSAGVISLDLAARLLRGERRARRALVVSLEPVSNLFEHQPDSGAIVGNTLFGEGCAAVAVSSFREPALWVFVRSARALKSDDEGLEAIKLTSGRTGPMIQLSKEIPSVAGEAIRQNLKRLVPTLLTPAEKAAFLATRKVPRWQRHVDHWAVHPGGVQVLKALQKNMKLADADFGPSFRVFEERSNMSSPSCYYALENVERSGPRPGETCLMMSFGSGFKVNTVLLRKGGKRHPAPVEKNAVVVGGTSGIGEAAVKRLCERGYRVVAGSRRVGTPGATFTPQAGVTYLPLDITDEGSTRAFAEEVWSRFFGIDLLVLSSGVASASQPVGRAEAGDWERVVNTNLTGVMRAANALVPQVRTRGRVVLLNSILGRIPLMGNAAYCASKAGLRHFAESMELELRRAGRRVTVHSLFPAYVQTPMLDQVKDSGKPLLRPVSTGRVMTALDAVLDGRCSTGFVLLRDRTIATLYEHFPEFYKRVLSRF